ncbi:hypothetical protein D3C87_1619100 [compost metagenome]
MLEVSHDVFDLFTVKDRSTTTDLVRNCSSAQSTLDQSPLGVRTIEHGKVFVVKTLAQEILNFSDYEITFVFFTI